MSLEKSLAKEAWEVLQPLLSDPKLFKTMSEEALQAIAAKAQPKTAEWFMTQIFAANGDSKAVAEILKEVSNPSLKKEIIEESIGEVISAIQDGGTPHSLTDFYQNVFESLVKSNIWNALEAFYPPASALKAIDPDLPIKPQIRVHAALHELGEYIEEEYSLDYEVDLNTPAGIVKTLFEAAGIETPEQHIKNIATESIGEFGIFAEEARVAIEIANPAEITELAGVTEFAEGVFHKALTAGVIYGLYEAFKKFLSLYGELDRGEKNALQVAQALLVVAVTSGSKSLLFAFIVGLIAQFIGPLILIPAVIFAPFGIKRLIDEPEKLRRAFWDGLDATQKADLKARADSAGFNLEQFFIPKNAPGLAL